MSPRRAAPVRGLLGFVVLRGLVALIALPVLAADPSPSASGLTASEVPSTPPSAQPTPTAAATATPEAAPAADPTLAPAATSAPAATPEPDATRAPKPDKGPKGPETDIRVTGQVTATTDAKGRRHFTVTAGGVTYELGAGPPWFWGDDHPLLPFAGKTATIAGTIHEGSTEIDVMTVNGTAIREPGRPPWAVGWKAVGERHPGWSQEKADRFKAKFGDCFPPGQCKDKPADDD